MPSQGSVIARVYTSDAYIPLADVPVTFSRVLPDGSREVLAVRRTNSSGLTEPLLVDTPDTNESLQPDPVLKPYATIEIRAERPGYGRIEALGVQIFPGVETIQGLQLQPNRADISIDASSQNL